MASLTNWIKGAYLSLLPAFFLGTGAESLDKYLSEAIQLNDEEAIDMLISCGAKPDIEFITHALDSGTEAIILCLLKAGPDVKERTLSQAGKSSNPDIVKMIDSYKNQKVKSVPSKQSIFKNQSMGLNEKLSIDADPKRNDNKPKM